MAAADADLDKSARQALRPMHREMICPLRMNRRELLCLLQAPPILMAQPSGLHFPCLGGGTVSDTETAFSIHLDLSTFKPEEVKISTAGGQITIAAGHEETDENCAHLSRRVTYVYRLPKEVDPKTIKSALNAEGILSVKAEKRAVESLETPIAVEHR